ncbi:MAG TPA: SAM-dependent chlorinase/fluorinase, partial [Solirubrobacteraceae bacterium]
RPITFLSDYGYADEFAGVCRAVIARIAPEARVIDITHGLPRHAVRQGAVLLAHALPFAPAGVHLAIVDPGVGTERRPVAMRVGDEERILVGPDNGVLSLAVQGLGGAVEAVDLTASAHRLEPVTSTFHGRDLFAPVAAHLALGAALAEAGEPVEPSTLTRVELPEPRIYPDRIVAHVVYVDGFGNVALNLSHEQLASTFLRLGERVDVDAGGTKITVPFGQTFGDVGPGEGILYEDSSRSLALAINRESAAELLGLTPDDEVVLSPAP